MSSSLFKQSSKPWKPDKDQKLGLKFLLEHACAALLADPGVGKTSITLAAFKFLKRQKVASKMLVIAPVRVCYKVWPEEIKEWTEFNNLTIEILHGPHKDEALARTADIYVVNPEGLDWLLKDLRRFKQQGFDTLVVDELSKFKHTKSKRFKKLKQVLPTFQRRWGLTGSPMANHLLDLFGQCYILDLGNALGRYITHYRSKYFCTVDDQGYVWVPQPGAEDQIFKALEPLALRLEAKNLPGIKENNIFVDLPKKVYKIYDELEAELITQLEEGVVTAANAAVVSTKCRQVASGGVYLDADLEKLIKKISTEREWVNLHTEKVDAVGELVEELQGSPLLVAYDFEHDLDRLRKKFGKDVPYIGGGVSAKRADKLIDWWNHGDLPILLGHPQSVAHGLNMQGSSAHHVCWHTNQWNYELYDQFNRRLRRRGNKASQVTAHRIISRGTIDEVIVKTMSRKKRGQQALFDAITQLRKVRLKYNK